MIDITTYPACITNLAKTLLDYGMAIHSAAKSGFDPKKPAPVIDEEAVISVIKNSPRAKELITFRGSEPDILETRVLGLSMYYGLMLPANATVILLSEIIAHEIPSEVFKVRFAIRRMIERDVLRFKNGESKKLNGTLTLRNKSLTSLGLICNKISPVYAENDFYGAQDGYEASDVRGKEQTPDPFGLAQSIKGIPSPIHLFNEIKKSVIGIDPLVRTVVSRLQLHMMRAEQLKKGKEVNTPNEVLLFVGESGTGKSHLAQTAGRLSGLQVGFADASSATEEGWSGLGVSDLLRPLASSGSPEQSKWGIAFIDEICSKRATSGVERDISGANLQRGLLKVLEGSSIQLGGRKGSWDTPQVFQTKGVAYIFAGSFDGLNEVLAKQTKSLSSMGFATSLNQGSPMRSDIISALESWGLISPFCNRLTGVLVFPSQTIEQLKMIALAPKTGVVASYAKLLKESGLDLKVTDAAAGLMAEHCHHTKTYSRGLKSIMSRLVEEAVFTQSKGRVTYGISEVRSALDGL